MQQHIGFEQHKHLIERFVRVAYPNTVVDICSTGRYRPALWDGHAEIGGFVLFGLHGFCRRLRDLHASFRLFGFCAVIVHNGCAAAGGKKQGHDQGQRKRRDSFCIHRVSLLFSLILIIVPIETAGIVFLIRTVSVCKHLGNGEHRIVLGDHMACADVADIAVKSGKQIHLS